MLLYKYKGVKIMNENILYVNEKKIERTIKALKENNINAYFIDSRESLINKLNEITNEGEVVSCGGSQTLIETDILDYLRSERFEFLDRYKEGVDVEEIFRKSFFADTYFTSTNAITENGELYNVDGNGNRVAAMLYGPKKVIVIAGINKIVKDIDEAIKRNKYICAPANAKRLNANTPCKEIGTCIDCKSKFRLCCEYTVIKRQRNENRMHVLILNENLGF
jgi:hypothetical protein